MGHVYNRLQRGFHVLLPNLHYISPIAPIPVIDSGLESWQKQNSVAKKRAKDRVWRVMQTFVLFPMECMHLGPSLRANSPVNLCT
jgi:hypothetical protein